MPIDKVPAILGPTASGKTTAAFLLAELAGRRLDRKVEIISADSRQVYKNISISTSQPPQQYLERFRHYFIGELEPGMTFSAGEFGIKGRQVIKDIQSRGAVPLIVGGSGLYLSALVYGLFSPAEGLEDKQRQKEVRNYLNERLRSEGAETLLDELAKVDSVTAGGLKPYNKRRIVRALEVYQLTGTPISELKKKVVEIPFEPVLFGLRWNRKELCKRINERVERMLEMGLVREIEVLRKAGYDYHRFNSLNSVGIKEVFDHLDGMTDYDRMVELIKQNTRQYAKRQMTWFRKDKNIIWIDVDGEMDISAAAEKIYGLFFK